MITQPILRDFWEHAILPTMRNGEWFTSEKVAQYMPRSLKTKKFTYKISTHLNRLFRETPMLERMEQRRVAFKSAKYLTGKWAYRIKPSVLEQLKKDAQGKLELGVDFAKEGTTDFTAEPICKVVGGKIVEVTLDRVKDGKHNVLTIKPNFATSPVIGTKSIMGTDVKVEKLEGGRLSVTFKPTEKFKKADMFLSIREFVDPVGGPTMDGHQDAENPHS